VAGYSWDATNTVGPNVGGNSSSGGVTVGGNPNVQTAITSLSSLFQNPLTLALIVAAGLGALWIWKRGR
jgi:hypothetical protein